MRAGRAKDQYTGGHSHDSFFFLFFFFSSGVSFLSFFPQEANKCFLFITIYYFAQYS